MTFAKDAPIIGLVLQRSHLVTGDEGHYSGVVSELESRGAKVIPVFAGERVVRGGCRGEFGGSLGCSWMEKGRAWSVCQSLLAVR